MEEDTIKKSKNYEIGYCKPPISPGRPLGVPNKATMEFRVAITNLLTDTAPEFLEWLKRVSNEDPAKALDLIHKLAEYAYPKLTRVENKTTIEQTAVVKLSSDDDALKAYSSLVKGQINPADVET